MFGFGDRGFNPHRFVMNEIEEEIDVIPHECLYRVKIVGRELTGGGGRRSPRSRGDRRSEYLTTGCIQKKGSS